MVRFPHASRGAALNAYLSCITLAILAHSTIAAQNTAPKAPRPQSSAYSTQALDVTRGSLPTGFLGHDPSAVFSSLFAHEAGYTKSDFETSAAFEERQTAFASTPLFHGMRPVDLFCFGIIPAVSYDADSGVLTVKLSDEPYYDLEPMSFVLKKSRVSAGCPVRRSVISHRAFQVGSGPSDYEIGFRCSLSSQACKLLNLQGFNLQGLGALDL
jgi:hypothetical protein